MADFGRDEFIMSAERTGMGPMPDVFGIELPQHPYAGLRPFQKNEWPIFFGRELTASTVIDRLIDKQFITLHGDSGCGKSSLIRAGVMPRLERDHARGGATWRTTSMLPRNAPLRNLANALSELAGPAGSASVTDFRRLLNLGVHAAEHLQGAIRRDRNDYICVLVDQFEEVFQFATNGGAIEAQQFVDVLTGLRRSRAAGLHVILTMRSEYLGMCSHFEGLAETINETQYLLPAMDEKALSRAIREPARLFGGQVTQELANAVIVSSGRGQDQLPLMQHAMMLLYRRAKDRAASQGASWTLDIGDFDSSGGVAQLLSDHADSTVAAYIADRDGASASTYLEKSLKALTDVNPDGLVIRRPQSVGDLMAITGAAREDLLAVLEPLCADGISFIKIFGQKPYGEHELVDITHEALIRNWQQLRHWTLEEADSGAVYQRLLGITAEHRANPGILLGLREARDRDRWWQVISPTQTWADRYSGKQRGVSVEEVRKFIDLSLDRQSQSFAAWREQLDEARQTWERDKQADRLLKGYQLSQAEEWIKSHDNQLSESDLRFISASIADRERVAAERNAETLAREQAQLRALIAARRVTTATVAGMTVALILATTAAWFALEARRQSSEALHQQAEAELQRSHALEQRNQAQLEQQRAVEARTAESVQLELAQKAIQDLKASEALAMQKAEEAERSRREAERSKADVTLALEQLANKAGRDRSKILREGELIKHQLSVARIKEAINGGDIYSPLQQLVDVVRDLRELRNSAERDHDLLVAQGAADEIASALSLIGTAISRSRLVGTANISRAIEQARLTLSSSGETLAASTSENEVSVWDVTSGSMLGLLRRGIAGAISPDGQRLVTLKPITPDGLDASILAEVWSIQGGAIKAELALPGPWHGDWNISWSPDSSKLGFAVGDPRAWIGDALSGPVREIRMPQAAPGDGDFLRTHRLVFSPDSAKVLAIGRLLSTARIFDISTGREDVLRGGHTLRQGLIKDGAFSGDGQFVVTGGQDNKAVLWNARTFRNVAELPHDWVVVRVQFSPDGRRILTATNRGTVRIWDTAKVQTTKSVDSSLTLNVGNDTLAASFTNNGRHIFASSPTKAVLWTDDGRLVDEISIPGEYLHNALVSADGKRIVTLSQNKVIRFWATSLDKNFNSGAMPASDEEFIKSAMSLLVRFKGDHLPIAEKPQ